jgi:2-amino-4-hydroxy-6-hydroxymethyldihydropteridine diphosphokinase
MRALDHGQLKLLAASRIYETAPVGPSGQPPYANAVAAFLTSLPPEALLRRLKQIEAQAGRRGGRPWGERTLDLDLIDYKGLVRGWAGTQPRWAMAGPRPLILPHPLVQKRPFVLRPLLDVAPEWRHPVLKKSARQLWRRIAASSEGRVLRPLD